MTTGAAGGSKKTAPKTIGPFVELAKISADDGLADGDIDAVLRVVRIADAAVVEKSLAGEVVVVARGGAVRAGLRPRILKNGEQQQHRKKALKYIFHVVRIEILKKKSAKGVLLLCFQSKKLIKR